MLTLKTRLTTIEVEAIDTATDPLPFSLLPHECDGRYTCGDDVILTASDGGVFIGHLSDVEDERMRLYVELD